MNSCNLLYIVSSVSEEPGEALACALVTSMLPFPLEDFLPRHLRFNHLVSQEVSILLRHRGDLLIGGQHTNESTKGSNLPSLNTLRTLEPNTTYKGDMAPR